jgi:pilus assembly protein Flp/PilA
MGAILRGRSERRAITLARLFYRDQTAATAIEYGLIAALVPVMIIGGLQVIGAQAGGLFTSVATQVTAALSSSPP